MGSVGWNTDTVSLPVLFAVAPRMGSVGWNKKTCANLMVRLSRSPHGERGLEFVKRKEFDLVQCRSPHGERGLE